MLAQWSHLPHGVLLRSKELQHGVEVRGLENLTYPRPDVAKPKRSAVPCQVHVRPDDLSNSHAVDVRDVAEVQHELALAVVHQAGQVAKQRRLLLREREMPPDVQDDDVSCTPIRDLGPMQVEISLAGR